MKRLTLITILSLALAACQRQTVFINQEAPIYPDYREVTIPAGIAPLDFNLPDYYDKVFVRIEGSKGGTLTAKGEYACFNIRRWHRLTRLNQGGELTFTVLGRKTANDGTNGSGEKVWVQFRPFKMYVSEYPLEDFGLTYRKMAPGYETYSKIGIYQRNIHNFKEYPILESTLLPYHCMGCHTANQADAGKFMFHLRGKHGATLLQQDGHHEWLATKTDSTMSNIVYTYWHPSGNYFACTTNKIAQSFWVTNRQRIEVYDFASDVSVIDTRTMEMIISPLLRTKNRETYPAFSADGKTMYFCLAGDEPVPAEAEKVRYNLCSIAFDETTGTFGDRIDTVIDARAECKSITFPRPSYDGRWLMYCKTNFSCFPINRPEADLWILDLQTGNNRPLFEVNSDRPESFHNWSSNSHWFLFASRRGDNMYGRVYLASIDENGHVTKPFLLPQRNPEKFYRESLYSYNVPDFTREKVELDVSRMHHEVFTDKRTQVTLKK